MTTPPPDDDEPNKISVDHVVHDIDVLYEVFSRSANRFFQACLDFLPKGLLTLFVLVCGTRIINCVVNAVRRHLERVRLPAIARIDQPGPFLKGEEDSSDSEEENRPQPIDPTITRFGLSVVEYVLKILLILSVASMLGIQTSSFLALISMSALAVGLALKTVIEDIASGVLLIIFRPFKVGDLVEVGTYVGRVSEISIFRTILTQQDAQTVVMPNHLIKSIRVIINAAPGSERREDIPFKIAHDQDILRAKAALVEAAQNLHGVSKHRAPKLLVTDISELGIDLTLRVWMHAENVLSVPFALREQGLLALRAQGISLARLGLYKSA